MEVLGTLLAPFLKDHQEQKEQLIELKDKICNLEHRLQVLEAEKQESRVLHP